MNLGYKLPAECGPIFHWNRWLVSRGIAPCTVSTLCPAGTAVATLVHAAAYSGLQRAHVVRVGIVVGHLGRAPAADLVGVQMTRV